MYRRGDRERKEINDSLGEYLFSEMLRTGTTLDFGTVSVTLHLHNEISWRCDLSLNTIFILFHVHLIGLNSR